MQKNAMQDKVRTTIEITLLISMSYVVRNLYFMLQGFNYHSHDGVPYYYGSDPLYYGRLLEAVVPTGRFLIIFSHLLLVISFIVVLYFVIKKLQPKYVFYLVSIIVLCKEFLEQTLFGYVDTNILILYFVLFFSTILFLKGKKNSIVGGIGCLLLSIVLINIGWTGFPVFLILLSIPYGLYILLVVRKPLFLLFLIPGVTLLGIFFKITKLTNILEVLPIISEYAKLPSIIYVLIFLSYCFFVYKLRKFTLSFFYAAFFLVASLAMHRLAIFALIFVLFDVAINLKTKEKLDFYFAMFGIMVLISLFFHSFPYLYNDSYHELSSLLDEDKPVYCLWDNGYSLQYNSQYPDQVKYRAGYKREDVWFFTTIMTHDQNTVIRHMPDEDYYIFYRTRDKILLLTTYAYLFENVENNSLISTEPDPSIWIINYIKHREEEYYLLEPKNGTIG